VALIGRVLLDVALSALLREVLRRGTLRTARVQGRALGVAGAYGVALAAKRHAGDEGLLRAAVQRITTARPTAVNLARGAGRAAALLSRGFDAVLAKAREALSA